MTAPKDAKDDVKELIRQKFDLVVIGSGPAGQRAAVQAAKLGRRALIIEKDGVGGSCLDRGTLPSKTLREAVLDPRQARPITMDALLKRVREVIEAERSVIQHQLERNGVQTWRGTGSFVDAHTVRCVGGAAAASGATAASGAASGAKAATSDHAPTDVRIAEADHILIATGTRPCRHTSFGWSAQIYDSDTFLQLPRLPKKLLVLGAGVIGCEYASIMARLGVKVTLCDRRDHLLRAIDHEVIAALRADFDHYGMELRLGAEFPRLEPTREANGDESVKAEFADVTHHFDAVLACLGRQGNVEALDLANAGLAPNSRGLIEVNAHFQTSVPHIYGVGDIVGAPALASSSSEQGRLAAAHAFGLEPGNFPTLFPNGIYTIPEISSVGLSEDDLRAQNVDFVAGRAPFRELARGRILDEETGFLKLLVDRETHQIRGVHIIGPGATELVHIGQVAMSLNARVEYIAQQVFNYPTLAEAYKVAAYHALNQLRGHAK